MISLKQAMLLGTLAIAYSAGVSPARLSFVQPAYANDHHHDHDHDIAKAEARVDRVEQRLDRAQAKGHEEVADRIRAHDLDQAQDRLDALRDRDHDHH